MRPNEAGVTRTHFPAVRDFATPNAIEGAKRLECVCFSTAFHLAFHGRALTFDS